MNCRGCEHIVLPSYLMRMPGVDQVITYYPVNIPPRCGLVDHTDTTIFDGDNVRSCPRARAARDGLTNEVIKRIRL